MAQWLECLLAVHEPKGKWKRKGSILLCHRNGNRIECIFQIVEKASQHMFCSLCVCERKRERECERKRGGGKSKLCMCLEDRGLLTYFTEIWFLITQSAFCLPAATFGISGGSQKSEPRSSCSHSQSSLLRAIPQPDFKLPLLHMNSDSHIT